MKKNFLWSLLAVIMATMLSFSITSCGSDDDDDEKTEEVTSASIVGSWSWSKNNGSFSETRTFKADGTFITEWKESEYSGTNSGTYVFNVTDMKLTTNTLEGEGLGEYTYSVVLKGNQLTLIEKDGDIRGPMTKK